MLLRLAECKLRNSGSISFAVVELPCLLVVFIVVVVIVSVSLSLANKTTFGINHC